MKTKIKTKESGRKPLNNVDNDSFYYNQGYTRAFFELVLTKSASEVEIYDAFKKCVSMWSTGKDNSNLFIACLKFARDEEIISQRDIDKLMSSLLNLDEKDDYFGWMTDSISKIEFN